MLGSGKMLMHYLGAASDREYEQYGANDRKKTSAIPAKRQDREANTHQYEGKGQ
jgi:hypothetical protein